MKDGLNPGLSLPAVPLNHSDQHTNKTTFSPPFGDTPLSSWKTSPATYGRQAPSVPSFTRRTSTVDWAIVSHFVLQGELDTFRVIAGLYRVGNSSQGSYLRGASIAQSYTCRKDVWIADNDV